MANWATTNYAIEGPADTLEKIKDAILHHPVEEGSSENWEGNVLAALGIEWDRKPPYDGNYIRGFIDTDPEIKEGTLFFDAEEAWGLTDFNYILEKNLKDIKVYWNVEEDGNLLYATNDSEGKYFTDRYIVDACVNNDWFREYFATKKTAWEYIRNISGNEVTSEKQLEEFNENHEDTDEFINIFEFEICN